MTPKLLSSTWNSNRTRLKLQQDYLGQFHHGLLYLRHRHLGWPTFVDTLPNLVVTPSNSFVQILQLPHELQLGQFQHGLHNRQIQHRTAFRVQGAKGFVLAGVCFTRAYPSSKPKASTTLSQYCCHVHRYSEETCSIMSCSSPTPSLHNFIPTLSILAMSRLQNKIVDIYNTHDIRSNEKKWIKLGLLQTQASSFSVMYFQYKHQPDHRLLHHRRNVSKKSIPSSCISPRAQNRALNFLISPSGYCLNLSAHVNQIMFDIVTGLYSLTSHAFKASTVAISTSMAFQLNMQLQHNGLCMKRRQQLLHSHRSMQAAMGDKQPPSFTKA